MRITYWRIPSNSLCLTVILAQHTEENSMKPQERLQILPRIHCTFNRKMNLWYEDLWGWKAINTFLNILLGEKKSSSWQLWRKQGMTLEMYPEPLVNIHQRKKTFNFYQGFKECLWQGNCRRRGRNRRWIQREFGKLNKQNISNCIRLESKHVSHTNIHPLCTSCLAQKEEREESVWNPLFELLIMGKTINQAVHRQQNEWSLISWLCVCSTNVIFGVYNNMKSNWCQ